MPTALIVDDEDSFRNNFRRYLELKGWTAITAADGSEAIEILKIRSASIDGIVLDRSMPKTTGDEVLDWMYQNQLLDNICVVMLTAYGELKSATRAMSMGVWQYLEKPLPPNEIMSHLAPGIALKKCYRVRRTMAASHGAKGVLGQIQEILEGTLAPDLFHLIFIAPGHAIDFGSQLEPVAPRAALADTDGRGFVRQILEERRPFVHARSAEEAKMCGALLEDAGTLMAVPVPTDDEQLLGVLDVEFTREAAFDFKWQEVLLYIAELIGTAETLKRESNKAEDAIKRAHLAEMSQIEATFAAEHEHLVLLNREFRHRIANSVAIMGHHAEEARRTKGPSQKNIAIIRKHLDLVVGVMRELQRLSDRDYKVTPGRIATGPIAEEVVREFQLEADRAGVSLTCSISDSCFAMADADILRYCLEILVRNALEAIDDRQSKDLALQETGAAQEIIVRASSEPDSVVIAVSDTGIGFDEEIRKRLFAPLFTTKMRRSAGGANEGMGLYSAKRYLTELGGTIDAQSAGHFKGASFTITLRRADGA